MQQNSSDLESIQLQMSKWVARMKHKFTLAKYNQKPEIHFFEWEELYPMENGKILLKWKASNYHKLVIHPKVGEVDDRKQLLIRLPEGINSFTITAYGGFKKASKTIHFEAVPLTASQLPKLSVKRPKVAVEVPTLSDKYLDGDSKNANLKKRKKAMASELPIQTPPSPSAKELERLKKEVLAENPLEKLAVLQEKLSSLQEKDLLDGLDERQES